MRRSVALAVVTGLALGLPFGVAGCQPTATAPVGVADRTPSASASPAPAATMSAATRRAFDGLEGAHDARLGVVAIDTGSGATVTHRAGERFAFASAAKVFIAATVLDDASPADLDAVVPIEQRDLLSYAPVTSQHVGSGMTVRALLDAMLRSSDNTAANLLVARVGGPSVVQQWLRGIGDQVTQVVRIEPDLNEATPGDDRDTTTPAQFAADLRTVLLGDALQPDDRELLVDTMAGTTTGDATIRAGVPTGWTVADKTGTGSHGVRNDVGIVTPPGGAPIVLVVMTSRSTADAEPDDALVAAATRTAVAALHG
ncbi:class A beta-lactamase [Curtobacterium sp. MCPF17_011]|uniref:class A beta-lactamase n=1 Tax=unclassified Curtobacterium TaxID=257496 RepID=UPI000D8E0B07|nr:MULTISPECIES: class A beta-lactamase [unclassified Curtobacterium]PYY32612.1 class A beta-lactamase [Curtobacterium sp. MCBD17_030]PZF13948.1 class A beta-lactamase [Curtobacterium sp. MCPF17_011]